MTSSMNIGQESILAAHGIGPDDIQYQDALVPERSWHTPLAWTPRHWPNVFVAINDGSWLEVCRCGQIFLGADADEVRNASDIHMPAFVAWREGVAS